MPVCEADPWRLQYFEGVECPDDVRIPTEDGDAWTWYPRQRWVYNKLSVAESQGFACGPHGIEPPEFPVFSKPVFNMRGMGTGSRVMRTAREYRAHQKPGHIWMSMLEGEHISTDVAVVDGEARWWRHTYGAPREGGMFDHWVVLAEERPEIEAYGAEWLGRNLAGYTGMANFETIGARIIEVHLRFADQWPDLYGGRPWVEALVGLYRDGDWRFDDADRRDGYSIVLFGEHGIEYRHPPAGLVDEVRARDGVSSVQITFHDDRPASWHAMPPGGFRLAVVNCWDRDAGLRARETLALNFWSTQQLRPARRRKAGDRAAGAR
ncbi:MAG TPA: hypothetical protein VMM55_08365 [Thermohalobaculum sp.]|nr:hypothetical protein [Thermohalobaculum sp.]